MNISEQVKLPSITAVEFTKASMSVALSDGRTIIVPLAWYPRLATATRKDLERFEISPSGYGIHWPKMDEDLSVYGFLYPHQPAGA